MQTNTKASIIPSYERYGFKDNTHKRFILQRRESTTDFGREVHSTNWKEIAESDLMEELYAQGILIDNWMPCPIRFSHHVGSTCSVCGMKD